MGDLFGHQDGEELAVAEAVLLGPVGEIRVEPADCRQVQSAQQGVEIDGGGRGSHDVAAWAGARRASWVTTYSAPIA